MYVERIQGPRGWREAVVVRLFRRWAAGREEAAGRAGPGVVALAAELGLPAMAAVALDSLLQLTESCLGRPLRAECCCSRSCGPDEKAVLLLIAAARECGPGLGSASMPHWLPAALAWAASSFNHLLGEGLAAPQAAPERCPFRSPAEATGRAQQA